MFKYLTTAGLFISSVVYTYAGDLSEPVITEVSETAPAASAPWLPLIVLAIGVAIISQAGDDASYGRGR